MTRATARCGEPAVDRAAGASRPGWRAARRVAGAAPDWLPAGRARFHCWPELARVGAAATAEPELGARLRHRLVPPLPGPPGPGRGPRQRDPAAGPRSWPPRRSAGDEVLGLVEAPVIFVANHASHVDTPLLLSCLPLRFRHRTVVAAAADYFFDRRWKAHVWSLVLAAIPIERTKVNRRSAELAAELLDDGWNLVIFPEGGRTPDGWVQAFRGGAAYLAARTGRPVVPVHIDGTRRILPKGGERLRRTRPRVTFGTPLVARRGRGRPAASASGSRPPWPPWPTRRAPTGGRPAAGARPGRPPRCRAPTRRRGAGRGRSAPTPDRGRDADGELEDWPRRGR